MAAKLGVSERAIEMRRASLMKKLQAHSLAELIRLATLWRCRRGEPEPSRKPDAWWLESNFASVRTCLGRYIQRSISQAKVSSIGRPHSLPDRSIPNRHARSFPKFRRFAVFRTPENDDG